MQNSSSAPNPTPPAALPPSPSRKLLLTSPKPKQGCSSAPKCLPQNDKKTRDLPNLSDCHGCGVRINYSNPKERLRLLNSLWRIVLLCKTCIKKVNRGDLCPYCFNDVGNLVSDCSKCRDCERFVHKDCIIKYGDSMPWSYCCNKLGLGLSVCIDCWVPKLLRNSAKVCKRKKDSSEELCTTKCSSEEFCATKGDSRSPEKDSGDDRSLEEAVKDANCAVQKKVAITVKAKEKALRKAVAAKNAMELACNALDLVAKEDYTHKNNSEVDRSKCNGSPVSNVTRIMDDAELAFRLHRAINSSPRISKTMCMNLSYLDCLKTMDSHNADLTDGEAGKLMKCSNMEADGSHDSNDLVQSPCIRAKGSDLLVESGRLKPELKTYTRRKRAAKVGDLPVDSARLKIELKTYNQNKREAKEADMLADSGRLKPELKIYTRKKRKRKEWQENRDLDSVGNSVGVIEQFSSSDDSLIVSKSPTCSQGELKQDIQVNGSCNSSLERCKTNFVTQDSSANAMPDRFKLKYQKRITGSRQGTHKEAKFTHEQTNSSCISFEKETPASAPGFHVGCSTERGASPPPCIVDLQVHVSIGIPDQGGGYITR